MWLSQELVLVWEAMRSNKLLRRPIVNGHKKDTEIILPITDASVRILIPVLFAHVCCINFNWDEMRLNFSCEKVIIPWLVSMRKPSASPCLLGGGHFFAPSTKFKSS